MTWPSPTCSRMRSTCSSTIDAADHVRSAPQTSARKCLRTSWPYGVWTTSGWNWMPYICRSTDSNAATGDCVDDASAVKPGGGAKTVSRCDIQHVCSRGRPLNSRPGSRTVSSERPNSPTSAPCDLAAERQGEQLHAVTDAQHRDAELEQLGIERRRAVGVHRRGAAGEDQPLRVAPPDLLGPDVVRQQLAEHAALADAARDELRVLPAVVEDDDLVDRPRRLDLGDVLGDDLGGRVGGGDDDRSPCGVPR